MYKFIAPLTVALALALNGCQSSEVGRPMPVTGEVVATINGVTIKDTEVNMNSMARQQMRQHISPEDSLKQLVNIELLRQAAVKQGLHKDPKVIEQTNRLAVEINHHTTNILIQAYLEKLEESNSSNSEALQTAYDDYISTMSPKEYKARHMTVAPPGDTASPSRSIALATWACAALAAPSSPNANPTTVAMIAD
jgi:peptidyl-prolyl cis-trans isomerase C